MKTIEKRYLLRIEAPEAEARQVKKAAAMINNYLLKQSQIAGRRNGPCRCCKCWVP